MNTLKTDLITLFEAAFSKAFPGQVVDVEITLSTQPQFGHYQCNSAMKLSKPLQMPPRKISEAAVAALGITPLLEKVEIAGPGFINIWVNKKTLEQRCEFMHNSERFGIVAAKQHQKVVVDFSSPNIAKEMHVGHLRSTIIGDSLSRLFEFLGYDVLRLNHLGDWGTSFGMLIAYIKETVGEQKLLTEKVTLTDLVTWYKASKKRFDEDEAFKRRSQQEVVLLQGGDANNLKIWHLICEISERAYEEVYGLLGINIEHRGESFYNPMLENIVQKLEAEDLVKLSDGAKCIFVEGFTNREGDPLPFMIQKSDGGYNYATTDLAALYHRVHTEHADRLIYVVDVGQAGHFAMLFKVGELAHFYDPKKVRCDHVPFGLVLGPDGKKFKTRSGETEKLIDLLNQAVVHAHSILLERDQIRETPFTDTERAELAQVLGISAVKYADLSCNRAHDYSFSYERMLKFEGNTAAFLLYSYVRVCGIKRKIGVSNLDFSTIPFDFSHDSELALGLHLSQFQDTLHSIATDLYPNRLCDYLYELACKFNSFFRDCRVEGDTLQNPRLKLCELTANVLQVGLHILGLKTVDRM